MGGPGQAAQEAAGQIQQEPHTHSIQFYREKKTYNLHQCCESGSGWIRIFFTDPELFVLDPDPGKSETKTDT